jgi:hypothetical protein
MYPQHMKEDIVSVLINSSNIISKGWCRRHKALDISMRPCKTTYITASDYCLLGAVERNCRGDIELEKYVLEVLERRIPLRQRGLYSRSSVTKFNDLCNSVRGPLKLIELTLEDLENEVKVEGYQPEGETED